MSSEEDREVRGTSPFAEPHEIVEEGELENNEGVVDRSVYLDPPFVFSFHAAERKRVECVREALEQLGGEVISSPEPVFDANNEGAETFMDVVGGGQKDEGADSEGFTFADALLRANLLSETVSEGVFIIRTAIVLLFFLHFS